ncbi:MAG: hypothetical protein ACREKI_08975 [Gemmatimonadota bacterium]
MKANRGNGERVMRALERLAEGPSYEPGFVDRVLAQLPDRPQPVPRVASSPALHRLELPIVYAVTLGALAIARFGLDLLASFGDPVSDLIGLATATGAVTGFYGLLASEREEDRPGPPSGTRVAARLQRRST